jgi:hypothetical protein
VSKIESSSEFQDIVLSTLLKNTYMFSRTYRYITNEFFDKYSNKLIYKSLRYYYDKYSKLPTLNEILTTISEFYESQYGDLETIKQECRILYDTKRYDEDFVKDKITTFIKRNNVEKTLKELLPKVSEGQSVAIDEIGEELAKGLEFSLNRSSAFRLSNINDISTVRQEAVGSEDNPLIIKSFIDGINNSLMFKGYKPGDVIMIVSPPGTGKTMYMINEGANAAIQGFHVLHLFLGDMKEYDGFIRYASRYTSIPQDDIVSMSITQQQDLIRKFNMQQYFSNIVVSSYAAGEITIGEMIQEVYRLQDENHMHFDLINVDYADNLIPEDDMMYESGGKLYNKLSLLASSNRSIIIVGSQPKTQYWNDEIIPKSGAAESSKKQHVIDVMLTMGLAKQGSNIGSIFLAKVRRGSEGKIIRVRTHFDKAFMEQISEKEYGEERSRL